MFSLLTFTILDGCITLFAAGPAGVFAPLTFAVLDEFITILALYFGFFLSIAVIAFFILVQSSSILAGHAGIFTLLTILILDEFVGLLAIGCRWRFVMNFAIPKC